MYDLLLELRNTHQEILTRLRIIESQLKTVQETDERSREALDIAQEARALAQRLESQIFWVWRTIFGAIVTGAVSALFYLFQK
jgi:DNA-binding FrmR family transcriptional regulator